MAHTSPVLDGRAALVTGGSTGLGFGCARRLAADGAAVTICGRTADRLDEAAAALDGLAGEVHTVVADVVDEEQVRAAVTAAAAPLDRLDIAVVNAGGGLTAGPVVLTDRDGWERTLAVNLTGAMLTIKHAAPAIARSGGGSIVALSSIAGHLTHRHLSAYTVSKAGLEMLVRNAADELGVAGVRVNAVRPGLVPTPGSSILADDETTVADYLAQMPLGRVGEVEDVAAAVRFLAGDESSWITGETINIDGGHHLRRGPDLDPLLGTLFADALQDTLGTAGE